jgi:hypothetical protein
MRLAAEGEGFEPSIRLTTDNGSRDRTKSTDLQALLFVFASEFASAGIDIVDEDERLEGPDGCDETLRLRT